MPYSAPANNGTTASAPLNYATEYSRALDQSYPYVLNFGALYNTENDNRYKWIDAKTIKIPSIVTTGRVPANRDSIALAQRNYENRWQTKTLRNERKWSTIVHPADIDQTNMVATIANITNSYNNDQKFPEMDAYLVSTLFSDWTTSISAEGYVGRTPDTTILTTQNILQVFDDMMLKMDNARVPANGRILYATFEVLQMLKNADKISRSMDITSGPNAIDRRVNRLDQVQIIGVPSVLMKTVYDFSEGWVADDSASQINMFLVHPSAVITPVTYTFSRLDPPSAGSEGKYIYYEESFEDAFILNNKADALQFNITEGGGTTSTT